MLQKMAKAEWDTTLEGDLTVETVYEGSLYIPSGELSDPEEEKAKLSAELERLNGELQRSKKILSNQGFLAKAPQAKIDAEKKKQEAYQKQYDVISSRLEELNK